MNEMRSSRPFSLRSHQLTRREFAKQVVCASASVALRQGQESAKEIQIPVSLIKASDRASGLRAVVRALGPFSFDGKDVYLKGNFNSADAYPATTHPETLRVVVELLREGKCGRVLLAERSGMGSTRAIWDRLGISELAEDLGLALLALDDLTAEDWRKEEIPESHWRQGVELPRFLNRDTCVVQICNLKTHRFGGQFSASLKNSIGLIAKHSHAGAPYNYMEELHGSTSQRLMIAEVNQVYKPQLIVVDALQVFVNGGPEAGELASPGLFLASGDRVAADAAGFALLRHHGAGPALGRSVVFEFEQIKRAVELDLGAKSGKEVQFLTRDTESENIASQLKAILTEMPAEDKK